MVVFIAAVLLLKFDDGPQLLRVHQVAVHVGLGVDGGAILR